MIHAIFLDFKKPFDEVSYKKLCVTYGICRADNRLFIQQNSKGVGWSSDRFVNLYEGILFLFREYWRPVSYM